MVDNRVSPIWQEFALQWGVSNVKGIAGLTCRIIRRKRSEVVVLQTWRFPGRSLDPSELEDVMAAYELFVRDALFTTSGVQLTLPS